MVNCITNCSNHGNCTYSTSNKFVCKCEDYFSGQSCQADIRPCSAKPCLNNGTCIQNLTSGSFRCECGSIYEGIYCQIKKDICQNETCSKKGNCVDVENKPKCSCFSLYFGDKCEIESNEKKIIKSVVSTASIIAIITLVIFYLSCFCCDLSSFFGFTRNKPYNRKE